MSIFQTSLVIGVVCFIVQMLASLKSDERIVQWLPFIILIAASVYNLSGWFTDMEAYDYNDIISGKEADALAQALILGAGMIGCAAAGLISLLIKKK